MLKPDTIPAPRRENEEFRKGISAAATLCDYRADRTQNKERAAALRSMAGELRERLLEENR